jgi:Trk K+ transport system NAD-binding subunit
MIIGRHGLADRLPAPGQPAAGTWPTGRARRLAAAGMSVALIDRDGDGAAARARELGDADRRGDAAD